MKPTVVFQNVTKQYKMYHGSSERVKGVLAPKRYGEDFYALQNVSFTAEAGDVIGLVGVNGAGKSTLSNIIAGITPQTTGEVKVVGTVSVIAISSGLDNELTGRDNIRYKCLMLGFKRKQIEEMIPDIIAFSDIGNFIDQPVKNYSSGMKSRLGFAISVNVDPDVLIIDEALSVGDQTFKERCYNKMNEFKEQGKTIFFVSHALGQIKRFCDKVIWLEAGMLQKYGPRKQVLPKYRAFLRQFNNKSEEEKQAFRADIQKIRSALQDISPPAALEVQATIPKTSTETTRTQRYKRKRSFSYRKVITVLLFVFLLLGGLVLYKAKPWDHHIHSHDGIEWTEILKDMPAEWSSHVSSGVNEEQENDLQYVGVDVGNIRKEPDGESEVSGYAHFGEVYLVEDSEESSVSDTTWLKIEGFRGEPSGWVSSSLMESIDEEQDDERMIENIIDIIGSESELDTISQQISSGEEALINNESGNVDIEIYNAPSKESIIDRLDEPILESDNAFLYHGEKLDYIFHMTDGTINLLQIATNEIIDEP